MICPKCAIPYPDNGVCPICGEGADLSASETTSMLGVSPAPIPPLVTIPQPEQANQGYNPPPPAAPVPPVQPQAPVKAPKQSNGNGALMAILIALVVLFVGAIGCYLFGVFGNEPVITIAACAGEEASGIVGKWRGEGGVSVEFREDGTCTIAGQSFNYKFEDGKLSISKYGISYEGGAVLDGDSLTFTAFSVNYDLERVS